MIVTKVESEYTISIPAQFREYIQVGQEVAFRVDNLGRLTITSVEVIRERLMETFGMWADRDDIPSDGAAYVNAIRKGHRLDDLGLRYNDTD